MYPYAVVEKALAGFFKIEDDRRVAFRGRIRHLQKLGLAPEAPGSGKRLNYSINDICDLALAMSLAEFGADPKEIVSDIPSGTFDKIYLQLRKMDRAACIYIPYYFSGKKSYLQFLDYKIASAEIKRYDRVAIIDIDSIFSYLESDLALIKVVSPFPDRKGD